MAEIDSKKHSSIIDAYEKNTRTLAYRLSELVFGSMIVSYILGFIASSNRYVDRFAASGVSEVEVPIIEMFTYISISVTTSFLYSFLTAYIYYNYHSIILQNPYTHAKNTTKDFFLPLLISIAFGVSVLFPSMTLGIFLIIMSVIGHRYNNLCYNAVVDLLRDNETWRSIRADNESQRREIKKGLASIISSDYPEVKRFFVSSISNPIIFTSLSLGICFSWVGFVLDINQARNTGENGIFTIPFIHESIASNIVWYNITMLLSLTIIIVYLYRQLIKENVILPKESGGDIGLEGDQKKLNDLINKVDSDPDIFKK